MEGGGGNSTKVTEAGYRRYTRYIETLTKSDFALRAISSVGSSYFCNTTKMDIGAGGTRSTKTKSDFTHTAINSVDSSQSYKSTKKGH